jgi:hypothetical protein
MRKKPVRAARKKPTKRPTPKKKVRLLSGGNPQIAKGDGAAPVKAYLDALPGWKRDVGRKLDALIMKNAPKAVKAVKWNSPFYGMAGQGWIVSFHAFNSFIKVTFFRGDLLKPVPEGGSGRHGKWIDIHEGEDLSKTPLVSWVKQASRNAGWGKV